jgi:hypothetical protein
VIDPHPRPCSAHSSRRRLPANLAWDYCGSHECSRNNNDDRTMGDTLREASKLLYFPWNLVAHAIRLHRPIRPSSYSALRGSLRYRMTGELLPETKAKMTTCKRYGVHGWCESCQVEGVYALQRRSLALEEAGPRFIGLPTSNRRRNNDPVQHHQPR